MRSFLSSFLLIVLFAGCGDGGPDRFDIKGKVTFNGQPLGYAIVEFLPKAVDGGGPSPPAGSAVVENGSFDTSAEGNKGVNVGKYTARITGYNQKPKVYSDDEEAEVPEGEKPLFVSYDVDVTIEDETVNIDIPAEAEGYNGLDAAANQPDPNEP